MYLPSLRKLAGAVRIPVSVNDAICQVFPQRTPYQNPINVFPFSRYIAKDKQTKLARVWKECVIIIICIKYFCTIGKQRQKPQVEISICTLVVDCARFLFRVRLITKKNMI